jgi:hypothetical protein
MSLQTNGPISFSQIKAEFKATGTPIPLGNYYKNGAYVKNIAMNANVPTSGGAISATQLYGAARVPSPQIKLLGQLVGSGTVTIDQTDVGINTHLVVVTARFSGDGFSVPAAPTFSSGSSITTITQSYSGASDDGHFTGIYTAKIGSTPSTVNIIQANSRLYVWQVDNIPSMVSAYASYGAAGTYATPSIGCAFAGAVKNFANPGDISGLSYDWNPTSEVRFGAGTTSGASTLFAPASGSNAFSLAIFQF